MENKKHSLIDINNIDKHCPEHNENFVIYCEDCEKSFCTYYPNHPEEHNLKTIDSMRVGQEIEKINDQIQKSKEFINEIKELYDKIHKYKEINELEIKLIEDLIISYKNSERYKQLNEEIIMNIQNNNE